MTAPDIYRLLLAPLHGTELTYMVTGAVAAIAYGEPRMTNDVDVVVRLGRGDPAKLRGIFAESEYYIPPLEVMEEESARAQFGPFNILHHETALRMDVYVAGDDPLHVWALERRRSEAMANGTVWFAPVEYVIVRKLEYFRDSGSDRHLRDIAGIVRISGDDIDRSALDSLLVERGLTRLWDHAQQQRISGSPE